MREITTLQTLCLRSIGATNCSAEDTFAPSSSAGEETTTRTATGTEAPSLASRLLRSFHERPVLFPHEHMEVVLPRKAEEDNADTTTITSHRYIPLKRRPTLGVRRAHASDVDLNHPLVACHASLDHPRFVNQFSNPAIDLLQSYIDSLIEMGRMGDARLGRHFFREFTRNIELGYHNKGGHEEDSASSPRPKRQKIQYLGALSLYNATLSENTIEAMVECRVGEYLAVLDLSGVHGLSDDLLQRILPGCTNLQRLGLKNCRRITNKTLELVGKHLKQLDTIDIGGSFNLTTEGVIEMIPQLPNLVELHVSGLNWSNESLKEVTALREWKALSLGFCMRFTAAEFRNNLLPLAGSIVSLAIPFCENIVDNALLGALGRNLPHVRYLDLRGNNSLGTLTGWYDGRASADLPTQPLTVLGRYSGLSEASVDETKRAHPFETKDLKVILDGKGMGAGIRRVFDA